jgi:hypothetical protein
MLGFFAVLMPLLNDAQDTQDNPAAPATAAPINCLRVKFVIICSPLSL